MESVVTWVAVGVSTYLLHQLIHPHPHPQPQPLQRSEEHEPDPTAIATSIQPGMSNPSSSTPFPFLPGPAFPNPHQTIPDLFTQCATKHAQHTALVALKPGLNSDAISDPNNWIHITWKVHGTHTRSLTHLRLRPHAHTHTLTHTRTRTAIEFLVF